MEVMLWCMKSYILIGLRNKCPKQLGTTFVTRLLCSTPFSVYRFLRHSRHQSTDKLKLIMTWSFAFPTAEGRFMCVCLDCLSVPCQHLRKCVENSMENMHIDVSVSIFYLFSYSFFSVKTGGKNCLF